MGVRRWLARGALLVAAGAVVLTMAALPAAAEITSGSGCFGDATIAGTNYDQDTPQSTPVLIPSEDAPPGDLVVPYKGYVTFDNRDHSGSFQLLIGPFPITIVSWGDDNPDGDAATGEPDAPPPATEMYDLANAYDKIPAAVRGQFRVKGKHNAMGGGCEGTYLVEFEGGALDSPITIIGLVGAGFSAALLVVSGRGRSIKVQPDDLGPMA